MAAGAKKVSKSPKKVKAAKLKKAAKSPAKAKAPKPKAAKPKTAIQTQEGGHQELGLVVGSDFKALFRATQLTL